MKHLFTFLLTLSCYIAVNAQSNVPAYIPSSGLKAWYPFDGNANDASGHGYNGTALANATLTTDRFGNPNTAYSFNGANDSRITTLLTGDNGTSARSISFWFNPSLNVQAVDGHCMVTLAGGGNGNVVCGNGFTCGYYYDEPGVDIYCAFASYNNHTNLNTWYFYTLTYAGTDGNTVFAPKVYINGVLQTAINNSYNSTQILNTLNSLTYNFGGNGVSGHNFTGKLDDIGFWNRVLTATEIKQLYTGTIAAATVSSPSLSIDRVDTSTCSVSVDLPVRGKNLKDITALKGSIYWDTAYLNLGGVKFATNNINMNFNQIDVTHAANGYLTYNWSDTVNYTVADGDPIFTLTFFPKPYVSGGTGVWFDNFPDSLEIDTAYGAPAITPSFNNGWIILSDTPQIVQNVNILQCSAGCLPMHYQWYYNGVPVLGDTLNYIYVAGNGVYTCTVSYRNGHVISSNQLNVVLPVKFLSFNATGKDKEVQLSWQTGSEINTAYFNVLKSYNGKDFEQLTKVNAKGAGAYTLVDALKENDIKNGVLYYRIESIDIDGAKYYTEIRKVVIGSRMYTIVPNPARETILVAGANIKTVTILDNTGRKVKEQTNQTAATGIRIDIKDLAKGIYLVQIIAVNGERQTEKLLVD